MRIARRARQVPLWLIALLLCTACSPRAAVPRSVAAERAPCAARDDLSPHAGDAADGATADALPTVIVRGHRAVAAGPSQARGSMPPR